MVGNATNSYHPVAGSRENKQTDMCREMQGQTSNKFRRKGKYPRVELRLALLPTYREYFPHFCCV